MVWTNDDINNLLLIGKDIGIHLSESICVKLDLGRSIDRDIEYLYLVTNVVFAIEHGKTVSGTLSDSNYSYLNELLNRIEIQRNRFRNL